MYPDRVLQQRWRWSIVLFSALIVVVVSAGLLVAYTDRLNPSGTSNTALGTATPNYATPTPRHSPTPAPTVKAGAKPVPTATPLIAVGVVATATPYSTPKPGIPPPATQPPLATPVFAPIAIPSPLMASYTHPGLNQTPANVHLGLVFNSALGDPETEHGTIDLVWGSSFPAQPTGVYNLAYVPATRAALSSQSIGTYDTTWFINNHPDWIAYRCDRSTIAYEFGEPNTPLDVFNPAVQDFLVQHQYVPLLRLGYAGIAFDNVQLYNKWGRCGHFTQAGNWVAQFSGQFYDDAYTQAFVGWAKNISQRLHAARQGASVGMNFSMEFGKQEDASLEIMRYADILTDERGFTDWGRQPQVAPFDQDWVDLINAYLRYTAAGGALFLINEEPTAITPIQMQWALANYLLIKGNYSYLTVVGVQQYGKFYDQPEYHIAIGSPTSTILTDGCAYRRDYSGGIALVNPSSALLCTVTLPPGQFRDLYGNTIQGTLTMGPESGIVLLRS